MRSSPANRVVFIAYRSAVEGASARKLRTACGMLGCAVAAWLLCGWSGQANAQTGRGRTAATDHRTLAVFFVDQLPPQGIGPSIDGLEDRRRGPLFVAALAQACAAAGWPAPRVLNRDLSLPATPADQPSIPAEKTLLRVYLTQWGQTPLGGPAETEIVCRCYAEWVAGEHPKPRRLGPFFAHQVLDRVTADLVAKRWEQYQAVARRACAQMIAALPRG